MRTYLSFRSDGVTIFFSPLLKVIINAEYISFDTSSSWQQKGVLVSYLAVTAFVDITIAFSLTKSLCNLNKHIVTVA